MSKQYIAFFGTGKTTWCKSHLNWVDFDISYYNFLDQKAINKLLYFYLRWDYNLLIGLGQFSAQLFMQYATTLPKIGFFRSIDINIIIPPAEMREEMIARIRHRSAESEEADAIVRMYDAAWTAIDKMPFDTKVYLKPGQYLSDIIDENGEYKPGIEVIYGNKQ